MTTQCQVWIPHDSMIQVVINSVWIIGVCEFNRVHVTRLLQSSNNVSHDVIAHQISPGFDPQLDIGGSAGDGNVRTRRIREISGSITDVSIEVDPALESDRVLAYESSHRRIV